MTQTIDKEEEVLGFKPDSGKVATEKKRLRYKIRQARRCLSDDFLIRESKDILSFLFTLPEWKSAQTILAYAALPGEPEISPVLLEILSSGRRLILPRCEGKIFVPCLVSDLEQLSPGIYGIREPNLECPTVYPDEIDMIFVPGLAFDLNGFRLGQGGGYYDRFLLNTDIFCLGVCHAWEILTAVPREEHDVQVDGILTGDKFIRIRN